MLQNNIMRALFITALVLLMSCGVPGGGLSSTPDSHLTGDSLRASIDQPPSHCPPEDSQAERWLVDETLAQPMMPGHRRSDVWDRIVDGFNLPRPQDVSIEVERNWFIKHPEYMQRVSKRASRYLYYIVTELERAEVPLEVALLPIVESAFDPFAYSHGRASGMWQFIGPTGKRFGMRQDWWYDGRRDVVAATAGAIKYLTLLHRQFDNDWLLALAAYNTGEGNIRRAIRRNKRAGRPTDFWNLRLPKETRAYVPRLLALAEYLQRRDQYDASFLRIPNRPYFDVVEIGSQLDLAQAASLAGTDTDELYLLNPGLNRWATPPIGPHRLLIPAVKTPTFVAALADLPVDDRVSWERYKVRSGDSLTTIAARFNTTANVLKQANRLDSNAIKARQTLLIPRALEPGQQYTFSDTQRRARKAAKGKGKQREHRVRSGESLWSIAKLYKVPVARLARWNSMVPKDTLQVGQTLLVWVETPKTALNSTIRKVGYRVRKGDSLSRIAQRFSVDSRDISRWNSIGHGSTLRPGQSLTLYVDVRNAI